MNIKHEIFTNDGAKLVVRYYRHKNAKKIPLVLNDGIGCAGFAWKYFIDYFKKDHPIIHWNYRGHGESTTGNLDAPIDLYRTATDLSLILQKLKIKRAVLCGHSMGVQVSLEAHCHLQEKIAGYVLLLGGAGRPLEYWHGPFDRYGKATWTNQAMKMMAPSIAKNLQMYSDRLQPLWSYLLPSRFSYELSRTFEVDRNRNTWHDFFPYFADLSKISPKVFGQYFESATKHSAYDVLPQISVPTLLVAADKDTFTPAWVVEDMHACIPKSEYFLIKEGTHTATIEHPDLLNLRVEKFLNNHC